VPIRGEISVIIPVFNGASHLLQCLQALQASTVPFQCIVVDDGSTDSSAEIARAAGAEVLVAGDRKGPAIVRNLGAEVARADILLFIDSDVCVQPGTLHRILAAFEADPDMAAIFGSYDDSPSQTDFVSQYRNLMHHFVHQRSRREAQTFWSGFGAIRRQVFRDHGGFDSSFSRPAIEDIELGHRLHKSGCKIVLDPSLQVKHLKAWTFWGIVTTDVRDRAIPWTELMLRDASIPNDLNVSISQRISVALTFILVSVALVASVLNAKVFVAPLVALLFLLLAQYEVEITTRRHYKGTIATAILIAIIAASSLWSGQPLILVVSLLAFLLLVFRTHYYTPGFEKRRYVAGFCSAFLAIAIVYVAAQPASHSIHIVLLVCGGLLILLNARFYTLLAAKRGRLYALSAIPFHLLFFLYSGIAFMIGAGRHIVLRPEAETKQQDGAAS
jgi:glycosyltransferase involved in cell wall biosynthesis